MAVDGSEERDEIEWIPGGRAGQFLTALPLAIAAGLIVLVGVYSYIMNRPDTATRTAVISCLLEGCSIRSTVRVTGVSKKTVMRLLCEAGTVCAEYQDRVLRNLPSLGR